MIANFDFDFRFFFSTILKKGILADAYSKSKIYSSIIKSKNRNNLSILSLIQRISVKIIFNKNKIKIKIKIYYHVHCGDLVDLLNLFFQANMMAHS